MKTLADADVLESLKTRLGALRPDSRRRWGTLTPHEMLCDVGDATGLVIRVRPRKRAVPLRTRRVPHGLFGTRTTRDWQRWAYKHTDHHLTQFGL